MKKRVFIAINIPEIIKNKIGNLISLSKKANSNPLIKYVKPEILHLTLHFLGELEPSQIETVKNVMLRLAGNYSAANLTTGNINAFPNLKNPQVVFLETNEKNGRIIIGLQKNLGEELEKFKIDVDHRNWKPHITLARIKGQCQFKFESLFFPETEIPIKSIELMESNLKPSGSEYKIIESYSLKNA